MMSWIKDWSEEDKLRELLHFQEIASLVLPRKEKFPKLNSIDYFARIEPYKGCVSGDHIIIVNFNEYKLKEKIKDAEKRGLDDLAEQLKKNVDSFGILVADVSGHQLTDSLIVNYLHAAFKLGVSYELSFRGSITTGLFELLNTSLYNHFSHPSVSNKPYITLMYGEIHNDGRFNFVSAGHPPPIIFSNKYDKIIKLEAEYTKSSTPLGVLPSKYHIGMDYYEPPIMTKEEYGINEIALLGEGDILLLYSDGLLEQQNGSVNFCDTHLEQVLRDVKCGTAKDIYLAIRENVAEQGVIDDDLTLVVMKKK
jgi:serine phosphatase RsbU (regulator of sigma subunit)